MFDEAVAIAVTREDPLYNIETLGAVFVVQTVLNTAIFENTGKGIPNLIAKTRLSASFE